MNVVLCTEGVLRDKIFLWVIITKISMPCYKTKCGTLWILHSATPFFDDAAVKTMPA